MKPNKRTKPESDGVPSTPPNRRAAKRRRAPRLLSNARLMQIIGLLATLVVLFQKILEQLRQ